MAKFLTKTIETEEQKKLYKRLKEIETRQKVRAEEEREHFITYRRMEGMYGTKYWVEPMDAHHRGYDYKYEEGMEEKERKERDAYYNKYIRPLEVEEDTLWEEYEEIENTLCILLWGFDKETYKCYKAIERNKKEIEELKTEIENLIKKGKRLEKEFKKRVDK